MINIRTIQKKDIGRSVVYTNGAGGREDGHITSYNPAYIFVDYGKNCGRGTATRPCDLEFSVPLARDK